MSQPRTPDRTHPSAPSHHGRPHRVRRSERLGQLLLLCLAATGLSGCAAVAMGGLLAGGTIITGVSCVAGGGPGYRVGRKEVVLARCGDLELEKCTVHDADSSTFRSLGKSAGSWWGADSRSVYAGCQTLPGVRPSQFDRPRALRVDGEKTDFAIGGEIVLWHETPLREADPATFEALSSIWARDDSRVWLGASPVPQADPATFRVLYDSIGRRLGADDRAVYDQLEEVPEIDAKTVEVLGVGRADTPWLKDASHVYRRTKLVQGADPETFRLLDHDWSKDRDAVYSPRTLRPIDADPTTARVLSTTLLADSESIWDDLGRRWDGADPTTFQHSGGPFWRDDHQLWAFGNPLPMAPSSPVEKLYSWRDDLWGVGSRVAWCARDECCRILDGARPDAVESKNLPWIVQPDGVWHAGRPLEGVDATSFRMLDREWGRDSQRVYWGSLAVEEVDVASLDLSGVHPRDDLGDLVVEKHADRLTLCPSGRRDCYQRPLSPCQSLPPRWTPAPPPPVVRQEPLDDTSLQDLPFRPVFWLSGYSWRLLLRDEAFPILETLVALGEEEDFHSTGHVPNGIDPETESPYPLPADLEGETTLRIQVRVLDGRTLGPYRISFDPLVEAVREHRTWHHDHPDDWLSLSRREERSFLHYGSLASKSCGVARILVGIDGGPLDRDIPPIPCETLLDIEQYAATQDLHWEVPQDVRSADVQVHYLDGTASEIIHFDFD